MGQNLGVNETSSTPKDLFAGNMQTIEKPVVIGAGTGKITKPVLLGKVTKGAVTIKKNDGNTGDGEPGAVSLGKRAKIGTYVIKFIAALVMLRDALIAEDAGNTGNGLAGEITVGANAKPGIYAVECISSSKKLDNGTIADDLVTGNGTAGALTKGIATKPGIYKLTATGASIFTVVDPDGNRLEDLEVGTPYLNSHFGITVTAGGTAFAAGDAFTVTFAEVDGNSAVFKVTDPDGYRLANLHTDVAYDNGHFSVTIADGDIDFIVGDFFTVTIEAESGGLFSVHDPDGIRLEDLTAGVAYLNSHFGVTIANGAVDFTVGDSFELTVAAGSGKYKKYSPEATDGSQYPLCLIGHGIDATAEVKTTAYFAGCFNKAAIYNIDSNALAWLEENNSNLIIKELR
ncbi:MAG: hypothetical protein ACOX2F_07255 [bacterium]